MTVVDQEPNGTPQTANTLSGAAVIAGMMDGSDQDGYRWTVSDEDAGKRWTLELDGIPGRVTVVDVLSLGYDVAGNATQSDRLFSIATRDGSQTIVAHDLIFEPGEFLLGVAQAGSGGAYRPPAAAMSLESSSAVVETGNEVGGYRVRLIDRASFHAKGESRNVESESAELLRLGTETGSYLATASSAWYRISVDEDDTEVRRGVHVQVPVGRRIHASLSTSDGEKLTEATSDLLGKLAFPELALVPGEYLLEVRPTLEAGEAPGYVHTVTVENDGQRIAGDEAEPNGSWQLANSIDFDNCCTGRIGEANDRDYFAFVVDETRAKSLQSIALESESSTAFDVCLIDRSGTEIQCRDGAGSVVLGNLLLPAGQYGFYVSRGSIGDDYRLTFETFGEPSAGQETEPNDKIAYSSGTPANHRIKGSFDGSGDVDFYRFVVADEPQLWRVQAIGEGLQRIAYHDGSGHQSQLIDVSAGDRSARLENLYLLPGVHFVSVSGRGSGTYTLLARKLGPPDPNAELEPNDDRSRMQRLHVGQTRTGLLAQASDVDMYRFYLSNDDHIRLTATPPADGRLRAELYYNAAYGGSPVQTVQGVDGPVVIHDRFAPGDYYLKLRAEQTSDAEYTLSMERLDAFACVADCVESAELPLELTLQLDAETVAAYERVGQLVPGRLRIRNEGSTILELTLDSHVSDARWHVRFDSNELRIAPGAQQAVELSVHVGADGWADIPVRVGVRASAAHGRFASTFADITVDRTAPPLNPTHAWNVPEELRGGLNAALIQFGAAPSSVPEAMYPPENLRYAFDGQVAVNTGPEFVNTSDQPLTITVDLAGSAVVPVAGFAINPIARPYLHRTPRDVEFQLSLDGSEFQTVATGNVNTVGVDQFFALDAPMGARFARLLVHNNWFQGTDYGNTLGGFKVIAQPGYDLHSGHAVNIADPALGGHVVWARPWISPGWDRVLLTESLESPSVRVAPNRPLEWVIGFNDNRAAQITNISWTESSGSSATEAIDAMTVSVSLDSPSGPWRTIAEWTRADGDLSIELGSPAWARFVRFSVPPADRDRSIRVPDRLQIIERNTGADYRSVLSEWGYRSTSAYFESTRPISQRATVAHRKNTSRAAADNLRAGTIEAGRVSLGASSHWYRVLLPPDHNVLQIALSGVPTVRSELSVSDSNGGALPLHRLETGSTSSRHLYEAHVDPGESVFVEVREPPRNVMFLWDTSPSVNPYLSMIYNSMIAYAGDLVPGRDAANLLPFGSSTPLLQDWHGEPYLMQMILNDYPRTDSSSSAEFTQYAAAQRLASRPGSKAIVMITDASTPRHAPVWDAFQDVRPRVFVMKIASDAVDPVNAELEQDLSQDWAMVNGGHYTYLANEGEMDIAFDRVAALLRRPAEYTLALETEFRESPGPGFLHVTTGTDSQAAVGAVELILDASGSMWQRLDGRTRIDIAKDVLTSALREHVPSGTPTALRVFGHRQPNACDTNLEIPLQALDAEAAIATINGVTPQSLARTPIAASLAAVSQDLARHDGRGNRSAGHGWPRDL